VSEIIETHIGVSAATAIFLEKRGLGTGHVGVEAAETHDTRTTTTESV
jgi:hypothetical protein